MENTKFTPKTKLWKNALVDHKCMDMLLKDALFYERCLEFNDAKMAKKSLKKEEKTPKSNKKKES
jgi:hypothetical protein